MTLPWGFFIQDNLPAPAWWATYPRDKASDDTTIELRVVAVGDATGYRFYGSETPGFTPGPGNLLFSQVGATYDHTGLDIGDTWYYRVRGFNPSQEGLLGVEGSAQVIPRVPGVPTVSAARVSFERIDVTISAGSPDTADDYGLQRQDRACGGSYGAWATLPGDKPAGVFEDLTVVEGREYNYQARGQNLGGNSTYSTPDSAPAYDDPVTGAWTATYPKLGTPAYSVIDYSFAAGSGTIDGYDIRYRIQGSGWPGTPQIENDPATSGSLTGLDDGAIYEIQHRAVNDCGGAGSWSSIGTVLTLVAAPADPPLWDSGFPKDDPADDDSILGSWDAVAEADDYQVYWKASTMSGDPIANGGTLLQDSASMTFDHDVGGSGITRFYMVRGTNAGGEGPWSSEESAASAVRVPGTPSVGTVTWAPYEATVPFAAGSPDTATLYRIQYNRAPCGGGFTGWTTAGTDTVSPFVHATIEGYTYKYRIRAENTSGNSAYSGESNPIESWDAPVTGAWTATYPKKGTDPETEIDWSFAAGSGMVDGWDVRYRVQGDGWPGTPQLEDTDSMSGTFSGLSDGETYELQHRARNDCAEYGDWSSIGTVTLDVAAPPAPAGITIGPKQATSDTMVVEWNAGGPADDFDVYMALAPMGGDPTATGTQVGGDTSTGLIDVDVASLLGASGDDQVYVNVRGKIGGVEGPWGTEANGYTHLEIPDMTVALDMGDCPAITFDLTLAHLNTDGDARSETIVVQRDDGAGYVAISGSPFAAGTTGINDTGATTNTTHYRAKYSSAGSWRTRPANPTCPE